MLKLIEKYTIFSLERGNYSKLLKLKMLQNFSTQTTEKPLKMEREKFEEEEEKVKLRAL